MAQHPVQLNLRIFQYWGTHRFPGEIIPMPDNSHCEKFSSYVQLESPKEQPVPITPCLFHITPCKNGNGEKILRRRKVL